MGQGRDEQSSENSRPSEGVKTRQPISGFPILSSASDNTSNTISFPNGHGVSDA